MISSPNSLRNLVLAELARHSRPLRSVHLARYITRPADAVGSVLHLIHKAGQASRIRVPGDSFYSYFLTPEQKADWTAQYGEAVVVKRIEVRVEPIDIPARLRFLEMLTENPAMQDYAQLHNIISDYRRTLAVQRGEELVEEEEAA